MTKNCKLTTLALFLILLVTGTGAARGQTYLINEGFEGNDFPPSGWTIIDNDGDGNSWSAVGKGHATLSGSKIAMSYTVDPTTGDAYGAQDNFLVTPKIKVTNAAFKLSFKYCAEDEDTKEKLQVLISETGNNAADFKTVLKDLTVENGYDGVELFSTQISLADYAGKQIYIAFRHTGTDTYALGIDDVKITNEKGPKAVSGLSITPGEAGSLLAKLAWTNPSRNGTGEAITSGLTVDVYRDARLIATLQEGLTPGEKSEYADNDVTTGSHTYSIVAKTAEGESLPVSKTAYIGEDIPAAIAAVKVTSSNGKNVITWEPPTTGANKGYVNTARITYKVVRNIDGGETLLAQGLTVQTYEDTPERGKLVSYSITPVNAAGAGTASKSGNVIAYDASLADINATPDATLDFGNPKLPLDVSSRVAVSQSIYYASDFKYAYGTISDIVLKNGFKNNSLEKPVKIWLAETEKENLAEGWVLPSAMTLVYDGTLNMPKGENDIPVHFSTPYEYKGKNIVMLVMMGAATGSGSYFDRFYVEKLTGDAVRSLSTTSYSADFDINNIGNISGDKANAMPAMRFIVKAKGVATVGGTVKNKATGQGVKNAKIEIPELKLTAIAADDGTYSLGLVKSGNYTLTVTATGYNDYSSTLTVGEGVQVADFSLTEMTTVTIAGNVTLEGMKNAGNVAITATGYSKKQVTTDENGNYSIALYQGQAYTLTASYPLYDNKRIDIAAATARTNAHFQLMRSLIPPFDVRTQLGDDGKTMSLTWKDPATRNGKVQWTTWGNSAVCDGTSSEYYQPADFYVAHAFTAQDIADSAMVGMSFMGVKAYLKGSTGNYYAELFRGTKESHSLIASKEITSKVSASGGWVEADFGDTPVEIRQGESYLVAIHLVGASDAEIGHGPSYSKVEGKNNVKWSDKGTTYNGYYAWNISAYCNIPGCTDGTYEKPTTELPPFTYSVYRSKANDNSNRQLIIENLPASTRTYTDDKWKFTESGKYVYFVDAVYAPGKQSIPAQSDTVVRSIDHDAGAVAILSPVKTVGEQTQVAVKVRIKNYGELPVTSVPVIVKLDESTIVSTTFSGNIKKGETVDVEVGTANLKPGTFYTIKAYTQLDGDAMSNNDTASMYLPNMKNVDLHAFRWSPYNDAGLFRFNSNVPETAEYVKEITPNNYLLNAAEYLNGRVYGFTATYNSVPAQFVVLDTATWAPVTAVATAVYVMDMAYDYATSTMYAIGIMDSEVDLLIVDTQNGNCTKVAALQQGFHTLACNTAGTLYAIADDGNLYTIDKLTGEPTVVGNTGVKDILYIQTMAYDHNTGRMFWVHDGNETAGELYEIMPQTAEARPMGTVMFDGYPTCMIGMYIPYQHITSSVETITNASGKKLNAWFNADGNIEVNLPASSAKTATVDVVTLAGAIVASTSQATAHAVIPVSLPAGVYIVRAVLGDGTQLAAKVQK